MLQCYQTRKKPGNGSSRADERAMMDQDWWLGRVLIPEEGPTLVITISLSNTQSHHLMAPKWQKMLCNTHNSPASRGKLRPLSGRGMCFDEVLWLFILVWRESEGTSVFLDGSGKGFLLTLCVDTMMCVLETKVSKPLSALGSCLPGSGHWWLLQTCLQRKPVFYVGFLWFENICDTYWNGSFWVLKWLKPLKSESHLWFSL